ncbi:hypothetical protein RMATCC62417_14783 [Rhizopus microsporus]|nr:hypothetical protein RMATCC62417_14783 [Rhizopus microsporus]
MQIKEHVFIVTGGASGLGEQVVRAIIDAGGYVSIFDINQNGSTSLTDEYTDHVCYFPGPVDVTSESQVKEALVKTRKHFSKNTIVGTIICSGILNAPHQGYGPDNMLTSYSQFEHIIRVNLLGTYCVAQKVSEILLQNEPMNNDGERGIIITVASIVGLDGMIVGYGTSKAAIAGLTLPLARELAPFGIRVMSIAPGPFEQMNELFGKGTETEDWVEQYHRNISHLKQSQDHEWDAMQKDWERFKPEQGLGYRATNPQYDVYKFTVNNPYLLNPGLIDGKTHDTLADSILALEAKAQLQTQDSDAWKMLGIRQQENERDAAAIAALRQAVKLNPSLVDAWLALAVSYTNENCRADAYDALEQWVLNHDQYQHLAKSHGKGKMAAEGRHEYITSMFLEAARSSPGAEMDADVQVGLGVLFNVSEEYEKAIDCFRAALHSRPQDYKLWNKLGATLANSRNPTGAIEAYFTALEINPNYVRARYNLAISCMNLGQHREAAEHLLTALALQQSNDNATGGGAVMIDDHGNTVNVPGGMSENVWSSLRMLMLTMNRDDMVKHCDNHNLDAFRAEFDF